VLEFPHKNSSTFFLKKGKHLMIVLDNAYITDTPDPLELPNSQPTDIKIPKNLICKEHDFWTTVPELLCPLCARLRRSTAYTTAKKQQRITIPDTIDVEDIMSVSRG
jgi:hypothetical protein